MLPPPIQFNLERIRAVNDLYESYAETINTDKQLEFDIAALGRKIAGLKLKQLNLYKRNVIDPDIEDDIYVHQRVQDMLKQLRA